MNANSTQSGRYATPRHVKAIDPGAFYAVDSWALARSDSFSAHSCVLSRRGAEGRKLGPGPQRNRLRNRYGPRSTNEEAYNNLQPTYTYPQPLASKAAPVPGSKFNRQGGSKFNRRGQPCTSIGDVRDGRLVFAASVFSLRISSRVCRGRRRDRNVFAARSRSASGDMVGETCNSLLSAATMRWQGAMNAQGVAISSAWTSAKRDLLKDRSMCVEELAMGRSPPINGGC